MHYYGPTPDKVYEYTIASAGDLTKTPEFKKTSPTVFYFHGFQGSMASPHITLIIQSYLTRADSNIVIVDWTQLSNSNYMLEIVPNVYKVADAMSNLLINLLSKDLDIQKLHLVGYSVGSHICGLIGRQIKEKSSSKFVVKRITALDPAFPMFYPELFYKPISKEDAELVDVIHTDAGLYGAPLPTGTVDFWPNGGYVPQPGCPMRTFQAWTDDDLCTHRRAFHFWAESIATKTFKTFEAKKCLTWESFKLNLCDATTATSTTVYMGIDTALGAVGNYYLETNEKSPFSKGAEGAKYAPRNLLLDYLPFIGRIN
ncbi:unnamed protein product [Diamesa hyperborea]